jgi:hypothetical protein
MKINTKLGRIIHSFFQWPRDGANRKDFNPWPVIAWRLLWAIPVFAFRLGFVFFIGIGWGPKHAAKAWSATE